MTEQRFTMDSYGRIVAADMGLTRYVKVEDLFRCETCKHGDNGLCNAFMWCEHHEEYIPDMRKLNATADVREVVRCKDCVHRDPEDKKCESFVRFKIPLPTDDDDFCPYGRRKG